MRRALYFLTCAALITFSIVMVAKFALGVTGLKSPRELKVAQSKVGRPFSELKGLLGEPARAFDAREVAGHKVDYPVSTYATPKHALTHKVFVYQVPWCLIYVFVDDKLVIEHAEACFT